MRRLGRVLPPPLARLPAGRAVGLNGPGAAEQRALAMLQSDRLVAEGCDPASPLVPMEREALIRSYTALCAALAR